MKTHHLLAFVLGMTSPCLAGTSAPLKLFPPTTPGFSSAAAGTAVATSEKYVAVGAPNDSVSFSNGGAVHVFDAVTGKRLRTLRPAIADGAAEEFFGSAVSISGTYLLVGAPGDAILSLQNVGSVYLFDLATGKQLLRAYAGASEIGSGFGSAVAMEGDYAVVGAPEEDVYGVDAGAVWVLRFDLVAKTVITSLRTKAPSTDLGDALGASVAISGNIGLVGAPGAAAGAGEAHLFSLTVAEHLASISTGTSVAGDAFGTSVALCHGLAIVGSPGAETVYVSRVDDGSLISEISGAGYGGSMAANGDFLLLGTPNEGDGAVQVYHTGDGSHLGTLTAPDAQVGYGFGSSVGLLGNVIVVGAPGIDLPSSSNDGGGYLFAALATELASEVVAETKAPASEVYDATHNVFTTFSLAADGSPLLYGTLTGAGAPSGTTTAVWRKTADHLRLKMRTGDVLAGMKVTSFVQSLPTALSQAVFQVKGTGTGITSSNDVGLYNPDTNNDFFLREGDVLNDGSKLSVMGQMVAGESASRLAVYATVKTGTTTVTSANDSAVLSPEWFASTHVMLREGGPTNGGTLAVGQITARPTYLRDHILFPAAIIGTVSEPVTTANNAGLIYGYASNFDFASTVVARKGTDTGSGLLSTVLGESMGADDRFVYRCTLTGVPSTENEALFRSDAIAPILQEGKIYADLPIGVKVSKFLRYWLMNDNQVLAHVTLIGTGVTSTNDGAILRINNVGALKILAREGSYAPGTAGAKYCVIQDMDADPTSGLYAFTSSLSGGATAANQAFFTGDLSQMQGLVGGLTDFQLPVLQLRKGTIQYLLGTTTTVTNIDITLPVDTSGAGTRGLTTAVRGRSVALILTLGNGKKVAWKWSDAEVGSPGGGGGGSP